MRSSHYVCDRLLNRGGTLTFFQKILLANCALAALGAGTAQAADEPVARIETVVVTAEKRSEDIQAVPISI